MATTQLRSGIQLKDNSVTFAKMLQAEFLQGGTWALSSDNTAVLDGLDPNPTSNNAAVTKGFVTGLVDSSMKSPDDFQTDAGGNYPTDYKGNGAVAEGDSFYVTDITNGTAVGGKTVNVGDMLVALVDNPGNTDNNWLIMETNRDQATDSVIGMVELATQAETNTGTDPERVITPLTLAGYITNAGLQKHAGDGMTEDGSQNFNVEAANASITVNADDIEVTPGTTNGTSLEVTATGLELTTTVVGTRTFNGGQFDVDAGANTITLKTGSTFTLDATADSVVLTAQPTGTVPLAVSTTKYVDDAIGATTKVFNELPTVTDGNANVTLNNTPNSGTERVYLNGARQAPGATNDYTVSGNTVTFNFNLTSADVVLADYEY